MKKGFIFDMDGVLVDNIPEHKKALRQFLQHYGLDFTDEEFDQNINGRSMREITASFFPNKSTEDLDRLAAEKEALYRQIYIPKAMPGLYDMLKAIQHQEGKLAVCTSAPYENVNFTMKGLGLEDIWDFIITGDQVKKSKPHPEIYEKAAAGLNLSPANCVVFEDSLSGIFSAKAAGIDVVGVATSHQKQELAPHTVQQIYDFTEISVSAL